MGVMIIRYDPIVVSLGADLKIRRLHHQVLLNLENLHRNLTIDFDDALRLDLRDTLPVSPAPSRETVFVGRLNAGRKRYRRHEIGREDRNALMTRRLNIHCIYFRLELEVEVKLTIYGIEKRRIYSEYRTIV